MTGLDRFKQLIDLQRRLHLARDKQRLARRLTTQRVRRLIQLEVGLSRVNRLADSYALRLLNAQRVEEADLDWLESQSVLVP
jgi:hypothetical protein